MTERKAVSTVIPANKGILCLRIRNSRADTSMDHRADLAQNQFD